jgi:ribonucleoside-triphosphate reductase
MIKMKVIKRNGVEVEFTPEKIKNAISSASEEVDVKDRLSNREIEDIVTGITETIKSMSRAVSVEEIQDTVESRLMRSRSPEVARKYIRYRYDREKIRNKNTTDDAILTLIECENEDVKQENSNKNPTIISTQRDYMAGEVSKDLTRRVFLPKKIVEAHDAGIIHFHDMDYFAQHSHNCDLVNLEDMLQNGTVISGTLIEKPHTFSTACNIATQIIAQVASSQYGGQSITLAHLAPFVQSSREKFKAEYRNMLNYLSVEEWNEFIETLVHKDIVKGVQTIQYQVVTLMTTNGQAPFITIFMDINEVPEGVLRDDLAKIIYEVLKQRIQGVKNEVGEWITPAFPKLIYCLDENNVKPGSKYYYLTELSAKCTAKRMVPDYISAKIMRELKGDVYTCMGCRSFLTPDRTTENVANAKNWVKGKKYYGRFNQGVVTINLVDVALTTVKLVGNYKDNRYNPSAIRKTFFDILNDRLEDLCYPALMYRHKRLEGTPSDVAPILWQYGALARLEKGETIDKLLNGGYSTISLGYAGLYEATKAITGESHTGGGKDFALKVMRELNNATKRWKEKEDVDFSLYGTPLESTTYKFAKCLQKRFGVIPGVTDHNYITNSYHVNVREEIDAFTKLKFESEFQALSPGGAISYVEVPNMTNNIEAVLAVIRFIYDNIMYAELNTKSDYCQVCGYEGEIKIVKDDSGKLIWECPNCKNRDQNKMNVARRTCGYIGTNYWNQGRTQEIAERVLHL